MILIALMLPAVQQAREAARRSQCKNHLKQIGLALHNYHEVYRSFPPAYVPDENGKPMHSWRVLILPFLEQKPLYDAYDFSEPWDSDTNIWLQDRMPPQFRCPSDDAPLSSYTNYAVVSGAGCIFDGDKSARFRDVLDGTSNTLMVGEVSELWIPWTKPEDVDITQFPRLNDPKGFSSDHAGGIQFLYVDGHVQFVNENIDAEILDNLYRMSDGNVVSGF
jgi:prepilin-type processing-associated H-X9-DG protein